jgi:hypothetical protein
MTRVNVGREPFSALFQSLHIAGFSRRTKELVMPATFIENLQGGVVTAAASTTGSSIAVLNQGSADYQCWNLTDEGYITLASTSLCLSVLQPAQNGSSVGLMPAGSTNYSQGWLFNSMTGICSLQTDPDLLLTSMSGGPDGPAIAVTSESGPQVQWILQYQWILEEQFAFTNGNDVDRTVWQSPQWSAANNPSYYGRTSIRNPADFGTPLGCVPIINETAQLYLSTFNPLAAAGNPDFLGSQIGTIQKWGLSSYDAVAFEAQVLMPVSGQGSSPGGVVASLYAYNLIDVSPLFLHDEIDFELSSLYWSDLQPQINTNVYVVSGQTIAEYDQVVQSQVAVGNSVTLRIEWSQAGVSWYLNKDENPLPIYTEPNSPQTDMSLVLNFWVPNKAWTWAYDGSLVPVSTGPGQQWVYQVNWAKVWVVST